MSSFVIDNSLPGVTAYINQAQVARDIVRQPTSTAFVVGYFPWGPVNVPKTVTSWTDVMRELGGLDPNSPAADFLYMLFQGYAAKSAIVCRVAGASKALATLTLKDKSAGAGINTVRVDAKYPSTRVDILVTVAAGTTANTFKLTVRSVFFGSTFTEVWDNRTLASASLAEVNQKSRLINLTDLASATAAPNNIPKVLVETALAGGSDDFAGLAASDYIGADSGTTRTGLQTLNDRNLGIGQVAIPGITTDATHAALFAHASTYDRFALIDPPLASDKNAVATIRAIYDSSHGGIYWPWCKGYDFAGSGLEKLYPPSAVAAGECVRADTTYGTHRAPANLGTVPFIFDVERYSNGQSQIDDSTREFLNGKDVNVIAPLPGQGIRLYGERVPSSDTRVRTVHESRMLKLLKYSGRMGYASAVFQTIDGQGKLFRDLRQTGRDFLRGFWKAGALYGKTEEDAFIVFVDEDDTTALAAGKVPVHWGVYLSPAAEQILLFIDNVPLTQSLSALQ